MWHSIIAIAETTPKIAINYDYHQYSKIRSEFGLSKFDLRQSSWPKVNFEEDFLSIFDFTLSFFHGLFKRYVNNKLKVTQVISTLYFLPYRIVHYYTQFNKTLWDHSGSNPLEKAWTPNVKKERWFCIQEGQYL